MLAIQIPFVLYSKIGFFTHHYQVKIFKNVLAYTHNIYFVYTLTLGVQEYIAHLSRSQKLFRWSVRLFLIIALINVVIN